MPSPPCWAPTYLHYATVVLWLAYSCRSYCLLSCSSPQTVPGQPNCTCINCIILSLVHANLTSSRFEGGLHLFVLLYSCTLVLLYSCLEARLVWPIPAAVTYRTSSHYAAEYSHAAPSVGPRCATLRCRHQTYVQLICIGICWYFNLALLCAIVLHQVPKIFIPCRLRNTMKYYDFK